MNAYKTLSILFGLLLTLLSSQLVAKEVKNYYINGINNSEKDAFDSADELTKLFTAKYGDTLLNTKVELIYNETQGVAIDLVESALQKTNLDDLLEGLTGLGLITSEKAAEITAQISDQTQREIFVKMIHQNLLMKDADYRFELYGSIEYVDHSADILLTGPGSLDPSSYDLIEEIRKFDKLAFLLDLGVTTTELIKLKAINNLSNNFNTVADSTKQALDSYGYYASQEFETQQKIRTKFDLVLNSGGAVNVIAHSQGNFFANDVITNINQPDNIRLLSVGSPYKNLPVDGDFVNLREDLIVRTNNGLDWNYSNISNDFWIHFIDIPTSFDKVVVNEANLLLKNIEINNDTFGHNLVTAYLKDDSDSRERIVDALAEHYIEMGGGIGSNRINFIT